MPEIYIELSQISRTAGSLKALEQEEKHQLSKSNSDIIQTSYRVADMHGCCFSRMLEGSQWLAGGLQPSQGVLAGRERLAGGPSSCSAS